jgi:hypothetical protein
MGTHFVEQKHVVWFGISVEAENDDTHISEEEFNSLTGGK